MLTRHAIGYEGFERFLSWKIGGVLALECGEMRSQDAMHKITPKRTLGAGCKRCGERGPAGEDGGSATDV
jgi:hypothetical protein